MNALVPLPTAGDVLDLLEIPGSDTDAMTLAGKHLNMITRLASEFTRGRGFVGATCAPGIASVIVAASARSLNNPGGLRESNAGAFTQVFATPSAAFTAFEQHILNGYRQRITF
mgnify:CR=1 FL=1